MKYEKDGLRLEFFINLPLEPRKTDNVIYS